MTLGAISVGYEMSSWRGSDLDVLNSSDPLLLLDEEAPFYLLKLLNWTKLTKNKRLWWLMNETFMSEVVFSTDSRHYWNLTDLAPRSFCRQFASVNSDLVISTTVSRRSISSLRFTLYRRNCAPFPTFPLIVQPSSFCCVVVKLTELEAPCSQSININGTGEKSRKSLEHCAKRPAWMRVCRGDRQKAVSPAANTRTTNKVQYDDELARRLVDSG